MSDSSRDKWDARYRDNQNTSGNIAEVLLQNQELLPASGKALDLACGLGGNALFLAHKGLEVHAWDISAVAIEKLKSTAQQQELTLNTQVRDIVARPPEASNFDVIVVSRFLKRELCPDIIAALKPEGLLFYQTYTQEKKCNVGPSNPAFLLKKGELPELFITLKVVTYQESDEAMLVARKKA